MKLPWSEEARSCQRAACGSRTTPAPYEKAQAFDVICKRAAHTGSESNQKKCRVGRACAYAGMHVCMLEPLCHP